jgi:hypothetical protein
VPAHDGTGDAHPQEPSQAIPSRAADDNVGHANLLSGRQDLLNALAASHKRSHTRPKTVQRSVSFSSPRSHAR